MNATLSISDEEYTYRKVLVDTIKTLSKSEYIEIFRIIKNFDQPYTENSNGIFFDLSIISQPVLTKIKQYMELCKQNKVNQEERIYVMKNLPVKFIDDAKGDKIK